MVGSGLFRIIIGAEGPGSCGMRLIWKEWDEYNPVVIMVGAVWMLGGAYMLAMMGVSGPLILWLLRAIPAIFVAMGLLVLIKQFQRRPKSHHPIVR